MEPYSYKSNGRNLGNAAAAAEIAGGISWESYQWYVRTGRPAGNPAPGHVLVDNKTGQRMYDLKQVRAWQASRKGRGNWDGEGARARAKFREQDTADANTSVAAPGEETGPSPVDPADA